MQRAQSQQKAPGKLQNPSQTLNCDENREGIGEHSEADLIVTGPKIMRLGRLPMGH